MTTIPGTNIPFKVYEPTGYRPPVSSPAEAAQRKGLLAMVHIAKKDLGLNEGEYEMILRGFKVGSSAELNIPQLERLVKYLKTLGWKPMRRIRAKHRANDDEMRLTALRQRCVDVALGRGDLRYAPIGAKRLAALADRICGVSDLTWCRDAAKLARLLAVLGKIKEQECPGR